MKLSFDNQSVSNSPSKIRGGKGALMLRGGLLTTGVILLRPNGHLPYLGEELIISNIFL